MQLFHDLKASHFKHKSLPPAMDWKVKERLTAPTDFVQNDTLLSWSHPTAERFTLYAYPRGMNLEDVLANSQYLKKIVYGNTYNMTGLGDISLLSIAVCAYDRYGIEHEVAVFDGEGFYDYPQVIFWELDGGTVDVELPKYVTETYILPVARKEGYEFGGWYKTKTFRGAPMTELVEGWHGTLYARWKKTSTDVHTTIVPSKTMVYDMMGRYVGCEIPSDKHGVFVVVMGTKQYKIVL